MIRYPVVCSFWSDAHTCYIMGAGSFLGVTKPGYGIDHPLPYSTKVKERVEVYPSAFPAGYRLNYTT